MNAYPHYAKTIDGPLVIAEAGIETIRSACPMQRGVGYVLLAACRV
jgi:hypothetical protein